MVMLTRSILGLLVLASFVLAGDLSSLTGDLGADNALTRYRAAHALGAMGDKARSALPDLIDLLGDEEPWVRMEAARALVSIGITPKHIKPLVVRLDVAPPEVTRLLSVALAALPEAVDPLIRVLLDEESSRRMRREAVYTLRLAGRKAAKALPHIVDLTAAKDPALKKAASDAVRRLAPWSGACVDGLVVRLQTGEGEIPWLAARLLAGAGPAAASAIPALRAKLATKNKRVADAVEAALRNIDVEVKKNEALFQPHAATEKAPEKFLARFDTTAGEFVVEVERALAPRGADRFYNLVRIGFFKDAHFFRVLPGFVVQFGLPADPKVAGVWRTAKIEDDPVKGSNTRGTLCFAMAGANTRTTQLFVNLANNRGKLDHQGFAPFGKVVKGMDVVDKLHAGYREQPDQLSITMEGNAYLQREFPKLDRIKKAEIVGK
jgi:peptidyl-prolyl cis-trans isomerase A (cyclophilin A)